MLNLGKSFNKEYEDNTSRKDHRDLKDLEGKQFFETVYSRIDGLTVQEPNIVAKQTP